MFIFETFCIAEILATGLDKSWIRHLSLGLIFTKKINKNALVGLMSYLMGTHEKSILQGLLPL